MSIEYREPNDRAIFAYRDDQHVATIMRQGEKFGYTIFNTPHMGAAESESEAKSAVERFVP